MKLTKKILLVLASTLLLAGCGDKEECPQCEQCQTCEQCQHSPTPGDDGLTEDELLQIVKDRIVERFDGFAEITKDKQILSYLDELKTSALKDTEDMFYVYDEESAIDGADIIVECYTENIRNKLIASLSNRLFNLISSTRDDEAHDFFQRTHDEFIPVLIQDADTIEALLEVYTEANDQIDNFIGKSPTDPEPTISEDIIYRYKQLLREEFNVVFDVCGDHLDRNEFSEVVESLLEWLDEATSEEDAYTVAGTIRDEFHNAILPTLKDNLWNEFDNFVVSVNDSISPEFKYIKDEAFAATQDTISDIKAATYYEDALNIFDGAVSNIIDVCIFEFRSWGVNKLLDVYMEYRSAFPKKTPERQMIDIEYNTVRSYIVNEAFTISNVESRVKEHIDNFTEYCEEICAVE